MPCDTEGDGTFRPSQDDGNSNRAHQCAHLEWPSIVVHGTIIVQDVDELELVPLTALEIVRVVGRGDLYGTGTKLHVDEFGVGDDGNLAAWDERVDGILADQMGVALVIGMHCDAGIADHGLGTGRGNDDLLVASFDVVGEAGEDTKLESLLGIVTWQVAEKFAAFEFFGVALMSEQEVCAWKSR